MSQVNAAPVTFEVEYPERLSRLLLLLKTFLGWAYVYIPHGIILYFYSILASLATFIAFFVILFTGNFPLGLFNFVVGYHRWNARMIAYLFFMVDDYPPFSTTKPHSVTLEVAYPERLSRWKALLKLLLGWLYAGLPHGIVLGFYSIAVAVVIFVVWWVILFTGRFPEGLFNFVVGYFRWGARLTMYLSLLRDEYPPFSGRRQGPLASPGILGEPPAAPAG